MAQFTSIGYNLEQRRRANRQILLTDYQLFDHSSQTKVNLHGEKDVKAETGTLILDNARVIAWALTYKYEGRSISNERSIEGIFFARNPFAIRSFASFKACIEK